MQEFRNFVLHWHNCIFNFDTGQVYLKLQVTMLSRMRKLQQTLNPKPKKIGLPKTLNPKSYTLNPQHQIHPKP